MKSAQWPQMKHEDILEVPEGKSVSDLQEKHFQGLIDKRGWSAISKALMNLMRWNKNQNPKLSKWADAMQAKLHDWVQQQRAKEGSMKEYTPFNDRIVALGSALTTAEKDPADAARHLINSYSKLVKLLGTKVDAIESTFKDVKQQCESLDRAGVGDTESGTQLKMTLPPVKDLKKLVDNTIAQIEKVVKATGLG